MNLDTFVNKICGGKKKAPYYYIRSSAVFGKKPRALNNSSNNSSEDDKNNNGKLPEDPWQLPNQPNVDDFVKMTLDSKSHPGGPKPEVVLKPPELPPKHFEVWGRHYYPLKDDVKVLSNAGSDGVADEHNWWKLALAGLAAAGLFYLLLPKMLATDGCPLIDDPPQDNPRPMSGKYHTSLPIKMRTITETVSKQTSFGRPQKDGLASWSETEKNWNTAGPDGTHRKAGYGAPGYMMDDDDDDDDDAEAAWRRQQPPAPPVRRRKPIGLNPGPPVVDYEVRPDVRPQTGRTVQCQGEKDGKKKAA